jgi:hypothetical protein
MRADQFLDDAGHAEKRWTLAGNARVILQLAATPTARSRH